MRDYGTSSSAHPYGEVDEVIRALKNLFQYQSIEELVRDNPLIASLIDWDQISSAPEFETWQLTGSVGLHKNGQVAGKNLVEDVRKVMDKLYQLELLSTKDYYYENLNIEGLDGEVPVHKIPATIAAIQMFQKYNFHSFSGLIEIDGDRKTYEQLQAITSPQQMEVITRNFRNVTPMRVDRI